VLLLGQLHERLGGSEYEKRFGGDSLPPEPDLDTEAGLIRCLVDGFAEGILGAAHDVSHGGLLVTVAEMMLASAPFERGCTLDLGGASSAALFSEYGGVVVEVPEERRNAFDAVVSRHNVPVVALGRTVATPNLEVELAERSFELSMEDIKSAHAGHIASMLMGGGGA
jgi:phosphoribosylformylglycinamidine synthase